MNPTKSKKNQGVSKDADSLDFADFHLDVGRRTLYSGNARIRIQKKPLAVLQYLIEQAPRMVPRNELLAKFWSRSVNEESLTRCISTIRKLLGDADDPPQFIETYHAEGYRFIAKTSRNTGASQSRPSNVADRRSTILRTTVIALAVLAATTIWQVQRISPHTVDRIERIAVWPISVTGRDSDWLQPALAEHLTRAVSRIEGVKVITLSISDDERDPHMLGRELNAEAILITQLEEIPEGSRLVARLVSSNDSELLWSTSLDSEQQISSGQQVQGLAHRLAIRLRPALQLDRSKEPVGQRAYSYYLQGRYYWAQRSAIGLQAAISSYDAALKIEPDYADALVGSAESWLLLPLYGAVAPDEAIPRARQLAELALTHDPLSARARAVLGTIAMQYDWNWAVAETLLREAVALNPNDATAQQWLGEFLCYTSRFDECRRQLRIAFELDPLSPVLRMQQGSPALYSGNFAAAAALYTDATRDSPDFSMGHYALGLAYVGLENWDRAIESYRLSIPDLGLAIVGGPLAYALGRNGELAEAQQTVSALEVLAESRYVPPSKIAVAYLGVGDYRRAKQELIRAIEVHDDRLVYFALDVHFRNLVAEDGFRDIASRIGF